MPINKPLTLLGLASFALFSASCTSINDFFSSTGVLTVTSSPDGIPFVIKNQTGAIVAKGKTPKMISLKPSPGLWINFGENVSAEDFEDEAESRTRKVSKPREKTAPRENTESRTEKTSGEEVTSRKEADRREAAAPREEHKPQQKKRATGAEGTDDFWDE